MTMSPEIWVAGVVGIAAVVEDLWRRRISNGISVAAFAGGLFCQVYANGWQGALTALGGAVCGFLVFMVFYCLGGMGGGDVKLMAGFGALLGAGRLFEAALWTAGIGGIIAVAVVGVNSLRRGRSAAGPGKEFIPYAPAITLGVWLALVPKP